MKKDSCYLAKERFMSFLKHQKVLWLVEHFNSLFEIKTIKNNFIWSHIKIMEFNIFWLHKKYWKSVHLLCWTLLEDLNKIYKTSFDLAPKKYLSAFTNDKNTNSHHLNYFHITIKEFQHETHSGCFKHVWNKMEVSLLTIHAQIGFITNSSLHTACETTLNSRIIAANKPFLATSKIYCQISKNTRQNTETRAKPLRALKNNYCKDFPDKLFMEFISGSHFRVLS